MGHHASRPSRKNKVDVGNVFCGDELIAKCAPNGQIDASGELSFKRVVFVSLHGLYNSWQQCPNATLYTALLLMPLKRQWIYDPVKYKQELESTGFPGVCFLTKEASKNIRQMSKLDALQFLELLRFKDGQGLVFWMKDAHSAHEESQSSQLIDSMWFALNEKLKALHDPVTGSNYRQLHLDEQWWRESFHSSRSKFNAQASSVLVELFFLPLKWRCLQEILYQSNPSSLLPMVAYTNPIEHSPISWIPRDCATSSPEDSADKSGGWVFSSEY